jgi:hypothetical protein
MIDMHEVIDMLVRTNCARIAIFESKPNKTHLSPRRTMISSELLFFVN